MIRMQSFMRRLGKLDLQAKVSLVLALVMIPTFMVVTWVQNQLTRPILEDELKQVGITTGRNLATEILNAHWLGLPNPTAPIEAAIQELIFAQPNIQRIDVTIKDPMTGLGKTIASNVEDDPSQPKTDYPLVEVLQAEYRSEEGAQAVWEIQVPIEVKSKDLPAQKKFLGTVHVVISTQLVGRIVTALSRTTTVAATVALVLLISALSYFLRRTIANDRLLRQAESQNVALTEQLHEAQRELMNTEKLAVMGQLTASFAHEIGTPLNATGGHLQLLREELSEIRASQASVDRLSVIESQLKKIEQIVKSFLQSTAKPTSQTQLVDLNKLVDRTLGIALARLEALGIEVKRDLGADLGPLRAVPLDLEQIVLNLINNSTDSMKAKKEHKRDSRLWIEIGTRMARQNGRNWAMISVYDTGEGIPKPDIGKVLKPFYTTKRPGEGTGLGLTICQQLASKYGGELVIESKEGAWTRVTVQIPYEATA